MVHRLFRVLAVLALLAQMAGFLRVPPARAEELATFTVNSFDDTNDGACNASLCSLRDAIAAANAAAGADIIELPAGLYVISTALPTITGDLTINGHLSILDGGGAVRIVNISNASVTLNDLTLRRGYSILAPAIYVNAAAYTLTLQNVIFSDNQAHNGNGGAIFVNGSTAIHQSLFENNFAQYDGGAIYQTGGSLTMDNTTLSGNRANGSGGAIHIGGGSASLTNVTLTANTADAENNNSGDGGGIEVAGGSVTVKNTLLAANTDATTGIFANMYPDCAGTLTSAGHNLLGVNAGCSGLVNNVNGDKVGTFLVPLDPLLLPLEANGGPSRTHAVQGGSPANNAGASCPNVDQRTATRPTTTCDIGAYQTINSILVNHPGDSHDATPGDGLCRDASNNCTLRAAIEEANASSGLQEIDIWPQAGLVRITAGYLPLSHSLYIQGHGAMLELGGEFQLFYAGPGVNYVELRGLNLRPAPGLLPLQQDFLNLYNAYTLLVDSSLDGLSTAGGDGHGISVFNGRLAVVRSLVANNHSLGLGSAIESTNALVQVLNSTLSGNVAPGDGGALHLNGGSSELRNATIANNVSAENSGNLYTGGGVAVTGAKTRLRLSNTLIAGNTSGDGAANDCSGALISEGYNLVGAASGCTGLANGVNHDQVGTTAAPVNARLSALDYYGGLTRTHGVYTNSPAYGAGNPAALGSAPQACPLVDQRGATRLGSACSIGAFQYVASLVVNDVGDTHDADLTDGACQDAAGKCTLRAAIDQANATPYLTTIQLAVTAPIVLALPGAGENLNAGGDLNLRSPVFLSGFGPYASVIDGGQVDRVMQVSNGANLVLKDIALVNGQADISGGLLVNSAQAILSNVRIENNQGTVASGGLANGGYMLLFHSQVVNNHASANAAYGGGVTNGGGLWVERSRIAGNTTQMNVAIPNIGGSGLVNMGCLELFQSVVENNSYPGGIGAGLWNMGSSGEPYAWASVTASLIAGNTAKNGAGIYNAGTLELTAATLSGNRATTDGGGLFNASGGVVHLRNATLTENTADSDNDQVGDGGGVLNGVPATLSLANSIVAGNHDPSLVNGVLSQDCAGATPASLGYNLTGCGVLGGTGDQNIANPQLGPLQNNGGPTFTQAPRVGSPALKAGNPAAPNDYKPATCTRLDPRGALRPNGGFGCDTGAFQTVDAIAVDDPGDTHDADPGDGACADAANHCTLRAALEETAPLSYLQPIAIPASLHTIHLTLAAALSINRDAWLQGPGSALLTLDGDQATQVLAINHSSAALLVQGLTITGGKVAAAAGGAGVFANADVTLKDVTVSGNTGGIGAGIGVLPEGSLILENSAVTENVADQGGGILNYGRLVLNNVTIAGNTATQDGGGLLDVLGGVATLNNVTLAGNTADSDNNATGKGGGLAEVGSGNVVQAANTILAGNHAPAGQFPDCSGALISLGYNLIGNTAGCTYTAQTGDLSGLDPRLGVLGLYGGGTPILPLLGNSPAVDAGNPAAPGSGLPACLPTDQHGVSRPLKINTLRCDMGAAELAPLHLYLPLITNH